MSWPSTFINAITCKQHCFMSHASHDTVHMFAWKVQLTVHVSCMWLLTWTLWSGARQRYCCHDRKAWQVVTTVELCSSSAPPLATKILLNWSWPVKFWGAALDSSSITLSNTNVIPTVTTQKSLAQVRFIEGQSFKSFVNWSAATQQTHRMELKRQSYQGAGWHYNWS